MMRDFEIPSGLQDADIEMADLTAQANRESRLMKKGICTHGWRQGNPDGSVKCNNCGKLFKSWDAIEAARQEAMA